VRADWLMAEDIFPVCSPGLLNGPNPLRQPEDLERHTLLHVSTSRDEWQLWLTAAGLPARLVSGRSLTFDERLMALQAAMDGLGVALGRARVVATDLEAGRLTAPFATVRVHGDAGYYLVAPQETAAEPKIALFRDWLVAEARADPGLPPETIA
jgi:LysR family glycine cleavage system transcriptional activator